MSSKEVEREFKKGLLKWSESRAVLEAEFGPLILSKIAAIVKSKNGKRRCDLSTTYGAVS